jgi:catechol 2,3-dioxygenase-like lactoylglutathione lyase family enzyme
MSVRRFDHVAIPIERVDEMLAFYAALGFRVEDHGPRYYSVHFGSEETGGANKINMHAPALWKPGDFTLRGPTATPGCGDFCFVWEGTVASIEAKLAELSIPVVVGPVPMTGGAGEGTSVYARDPDGNLLEFIVYGDD